MRDYPIAGFSKCGIKSCIVSMRDCGTLNPNPSSDIASRPQQTAFFYTLGCKKLFLQRVWLLIPRSQSFSSECSSLASLKKSLWLFLFVSDL